MASPPYFPRTFADSRSNDVRATATQKIDERGLRDQVDVNLCLGHWYFKAIGSFSLAYLPDVIAALVEVERQLLLHPPTFPESPRRLMVQSTRAIISAPSVVPQP